MGCAHPRDLGLIPSEEASKIMGIGIENDWNHALDENLSMVKGVRGADCGRCCLGQSGDPWAPGGECFAPYPKDCARPRDLVLLQSEITLKIIGTHLGHSLLHRERGAKHSPPGAS